SEGGDNITSTELNSAGLTLFYDTGTAGWDASDVAVDDDNGDYYIPDMAPGASVTIMVVSDALPSVGEEADDATVQNGDKLAVSLVAEARSAWDDPTGASCLTWPVMPAGATDAVTGA